ncbi:MAG: FAD-dependent oxidoreductase, partial [Planctomycetota bacterium]
MDRRRFLKVTGLTIAATGLKQPSADARDDSQACDVFVYWSTPGGISAAIEAARRGSRVVLACPKAHPGGMKASGLCAPDAVRPELFGGIVQEFFGNVRKEYEKTIGRTSTDWRYVQNGWRVEPSVAERIFDREPPSTGVERASGGFLFPRSLDRFSVLELRTIEHGPQK